MKKLLCILTCLAFFAACDSSPDDKSGPETPPSVIFGVMSDTHIGAAPLSSLTPETRLQKAYQKFTALNPALDAIITVGDFSENGTLAQYNTYKGIMDQYSTARNNLLSMGNHDNFEVNGQDAENRFRTVFGFDANKDTVINGYHFITVSTGDRVYNTTSYQYRKEWLEGRLAAANVENPKKPVFVFIHHTMAGTNLIGSRQAEAVGAGDLYDVFSQYPQVVVFSGHSHVSFADPRNIWQGDYTAINCGSVLYTALDFKHPLTEGKTQNALDVGEAQAPNNRGESSTALIVEVKGTVVTVRRIENYWDKELPAKFVFDTSLNKSDFPYLEAKRIAASVAPAFMPGVAITLDKIMDNGIEYTFPQAVTNNTSMPDDGAFAYTVSVKNMVTNSIVSTARLQAEYFVLPRKPVSHKASNLRPDTPYEISVTPIGYFGKTGISLTKTFTTAKEGEGEGPTVYPIPVAALLAGAGIPGLPPGTTMDAFITALTGYPLTMVYRVLGGPVFFQDETVTQPFTGTEPIDSSTIIYSLISLEDLMSYL
jgi:3',5'-cyclic AMP phosphodiesterase CpdA